MAFIIPDSRISASVTESGKTVVKIDPGVKELLSYVKEAGTWIGRPGGKRRQHDTVIIDGVDANGASVRVEFPLHLIPVVHLAESTLMGLMGQIKAHKASLEPK